jgi:hypothetical protein
MQVGERASILGGVDDFFVVVGEGVVEEDDGAFGDVHRKMKGVNSEK